MSRGSPQGTSACTTSISAFSSGVVPIRVTKGVTNPWPCSGSKPATYEINDNSDLSSDVILCIKYFTTF